MAGKYDELADFIVENVGGKENVNSLSHCITRLRFKLKDESIANTDALKNKDGVVTVMQSGGQYQVVIGNHVPDVYKVIGERHGIGNAAASAPAEDENPYAGMSIGAILIDIISGVFQPVLAVLSAAGMLKGFLALCTFFHLFGSDSGIYVILYAVGDGFFYFLPILLGATAAKKFGCSEYLGMAIGCGLCYPSISELVGGEPLYVVLSGTIFESNVYTTFLGLPVILPASGYTSSVVPIILAVFIASWIDKQWRKVIPDVVKTFVCPFLTLLISVPLTFLIFGPIASILSGFIATAAAWLYAISPVVEGFFLGAFWQVLVIFGLHWALVPISLLNLTQQGFDTFLAGSFPASFAQTAVVGAIMIKTKDKPLKDLAIPAFISGIFGVTEPAIYGITLPRIKYFVISCIGAAVGGAICGFGRVATYTSGGLGIFAFPSYINPETGDASGVMWAAIGVVVAMVISFVITWVMYKDEPKVDAEEFPADSEWTENSEGLSTGVGPRVDQDKVAAPLKGKKINLSDVKDEVFSTGLMGQGLAIVPEVGELYAPADGELTTFFPTGHAIGMKMDSGPELLIHVGMDTVELDGKHFYPQKKQGDRVKKGDLLLKFDIDEIKKAGYIVDTPILVVDPGAFTDIIPAEPGEVTVGEDVITLL